MKNRLATAAIALIAGFAVAPMPADAASRPIVVELFTSQGCSSCPPADAFLGELAGRTDVLALGFHVDYWDNLGWKDPLSIPGATQRQRDYARGFGRNGVYTPQMVIDGRKGVVGSRRDEVLGAIAEAAHEAPAPVGLDAGGGAVTVGAGQGAGSVLLIRFAKDRTTAIGRGENAGRTIHDYNGVEEIRRLGDWTGAPVTFGFDRPAAGHGVAILVQSADGAILGAASASPSG